MSPLVLQFPEIDPVAFRLGPVTVHWYALMYLLGFGIGYLLLWLRLRHAPYNRITEPKPWTRETIEDVLFVAIAGVIIGGRLGYCLFYKPLYYLQNPLEILFLWEGGMSFHGGALGVIIGMVCYAWRANRPLLEVADFLVPAIPTGLAAGRLGNFINGELWGRVASPELPWAMVFPAAGPDPRHPSQIYQFLGEGLLLAALLWLYARRERSRGAVAAMFLVGYGILRFAAEFFREPDEFLGTLGLGMTMGQWLSLPMIIGGVALWIWARHHNIHPPVAPQTKEETRRRDGSSAPSEVDRSGSSSAPSDADAKESTVDDSDGSKT